MRNSQIDESSLYRCCRRTVRRDKGPDVEERKIVCKRRLCRTPLVFRDGAWRWDKGVEVLIDGTELVR
jgi:hypothetical protein